jgi:hypothetical protein
LVPWPRKRLIEWNESFDLYQRTQLQGDPKFLVSTHDVDRKVFFPLAEDVSKSGQSDFFRRMIVDGFDDVSGLDFPRFPTLDCNG